MSPSMMVCTLPVLAASSNGRNGRTRSSVEQRNASLQQQQQQQQPSSSQQPQQPSSTEQESPLTPIEQLAREFPSLTDMERYNFLDIFGEKNKRGDMVISQNCRALLGDYVRFRELYQLDSPEQLAAATKGDDYDDWEHAWQQAFRMDAQGATIEDMFPSTANDDENDDGGNGTTSGGQGSNDATSSSSPPPSEREIPAQYMFTYYEPDSNIPCTTRNGDWFCHLLPSMIDVQTNRPELHALVITLYLNRKIPRDSDQRGTILMDTRPQPEWINPSPRDAVPLIQVVAGRMGHIFPNRLQRIIVFPVPTFALVVWKVIKRLLPAKVVARIVLISGSDKLTAPLPMDQLKQHVDVPLLDRMFSQRQHAVQIHDWLLLLS